MKKGAFYIFFACLVAVLVLGPMSRPGFPEAEEKRGEDSGPLPLSLEEARKDISPEEWERMERGEVIIFKETERFEGKVFVRAALILEQKVEEVYRLLCQTERQEEYLPHLDESILIERTGNRDRVEFGLDFGFIDIRYRVRHCYHDPGEFRTSWRLDPDFDNDLKDMEGYWNFYRLGDRRTLARYLTRVRIGKLVPKLIEEILTRRDMPRSLGQLKRWVESGGTWRKKGYEKKAEKARRDKNKGDE